MAKSGGGKSRKSGGSGLTISSPVDIESAGLVTESDLTKKELNSLARYQGFIHTAINGSLRENIYNVTVKNDIKNIDSAMEKSITQAPLTTIRGVRARNEHQERFIDSLQPGKVYKEAGYMSTTIDKSVVDNDFGVSIPGRKSAVITVKIPRGSKAINMVDVLPSSSLSGEFEILLGRNTRYRVISRSDNGNQANIVIEVIP